MIRAAWDWSLQMALQAGPYQMGLLNLRSQAPGESRTAGVEVDDHRAAAARLRRAN